MKVYSVQGLGSTHEKHIQAAIDKATADKTFRAALLSKPIDTLSAFIGLDIPQDFKIRFIENDGATLTIVLPDLQGEHAGELSDAALDAVAGGDAWIDLPPGCSIDERPPDDWKSQNG